MHRSDIRNFLDATLLKTAEQLGITRAAYDTLVSEFVADAIREKFKLVMVRPERVAATTAAIRAAGSNVLCGTVVAFPDGKASLEEKLAEAAQAIADGADELDFVCDYQVFRAGEKTQVKAEILACTEFVLSHSRTIKWIIETAALTDAEIIRLTALIRNVVIRNFKEDRYPQVFIKSSTGFFETKDGRPNGATRETVIMMLENGSPLPIKASGGIQDTATASEYLRMGVKRIGTSAAKAIAEGGVAVGTY